MVLIFVITLMNSCAYNTESDLSGGADCDISAVAYSQHVLPLLENSCLGCHNSSDPSGGVNLEGYDNLLTWVEDGTFFCSINHDGGCSEMPQNQPQLADCDILLIKTWIDEGAQNN